VLSNKYRVERILGAGGMGVVVAATQLELDRLVALKFLSPRVLERPDVASRFSREARAAARLQSEHVARVLDVGAAEPVGPYIVMEYLEGMDLRKTVETRGPLPIDEAVRHVLEATEAVAEAHSIGIVHRDLKPANLFLAKRIGRSPAVKVLDFGLSKFAADGEARLTSDSRILGSPVYMPPEQLLSAPDVDPRSDIWALGIVLYELLTARTPFSSEHLPELVTAILHSSPDPIEAWRADVPPHVAQVVRRCLEKDPGRRFANVAEMAIRLGPEPVHRGCIERIANVLGVGTDAEAKAPAGSLADTMTERHDPRAGVIDSAPAASHTIKRTPATAQLPAGSRPGVRRRTSAIVWPASAVALVVATSFSMLRSTSNRGDTPAAIQAPPLPTPFPSEPPPSTATSSVPSQAPSSSPSDSSAASTARPIDGRPPTGSSAAQRPPTGPSVVRPNVAMTSSVLPAAASRSASTSRAAPSASAPGPTPAPSTDPVGGLKPL
jgi:serine/threonine-protein kinase